MPLHRWAYIAWREASVDGQVVCASTAVQPKVVIPSTCLAVFASIAWAKILQTLSSRRGLEKGGGSGTHVNVEETLPRASRLLKQCDRERVKRGKEI